MRSLPGQCLYAKLSKNQFSWLTLKILSGCIRMASTFLLTVRWVYWTFTLNKVLKELKQTRLKLLAFKFKNAARHLINDYLFLVFDRPIVLLFWHIFPIKGKIKWMFQPKDGICPEHWMPDDGGGCPIVKHHIGQRERWQRTNQPQFSSFFSCVS